RVVSRRSRLVSVLVAILVIVLVAMAPTLRSSRGTALDLTVTRAVQRIDAPAFTDLMVAVSAPGYWPWTWVVLLSASLALVAIGLPREAIFVLATEGAPMLAAGVKVLVERPRPSTGL